jgi:Xaa-Pro dipeptidase
MVVTVEPGIYFIESQMNRAMHSPEFAAYVNKERLEQVSRQRRQAEGRLADTGRFVRQFRDFGGVRIEDVVLVTHDGVENFTQTPRSPDEVRQLLPATPRCGT